MIATLQNWKDDVESIWDPRSNGEVMFETRPVTSVLLIERNSADRKATCPSSPTDCARQSAQQSLYNGRKSIDLLDKHKHLCLRLVPGKDINTFLELWIQRDTLLVLNLNTLGDEIRAGQSPRRPDS